ncbi:LamG domain-containing protein, partial [bacterium]|nr:LamG domain-containing protein [bacterium]
MIRNIPNTTYQILKRVRYFITKTRRRKILVFLLALLVLFTSIRLIFFAPSDIEAAWSPTHNAWARRKRLTITNDSTDSLASGTAIAVSIDTKTLYQLGKVQEDCDDIRIVHQPNSSTYTNLDRYLSVPGGVSCSTSGATKVYFQLQAALASSASSTDYYMYYDNDKASAPANSDNAFDIGSKDALLVCPFDGSTTCAAAEIPSTATGALRYEGGKGAIIFDGHNDCLDDDLTVNIGGFEQLTIEYWIKSDALNGKNEGRIFTTGSYYLGYSPSNNSYQLDIQIGGSWYYFNTTTDSAPNDSDWHHYAVTYDGNALRWFIDGTLKNTNTNPSGSIDTTGSSFHMPGNNGCGVIYRAAFDEFRTSEIARYTSDFT